MADRLQFVRVQTSKKKGAMTPPSFSMGMNNQLIFGSNAPLVYTWNMLSNDLALIFEA